MTQDRQEDKPFIGFLELYDLIDGWYHTQTRHHLVDVDPEAKDNLFEPLMAAIERYTEQRVKAAYCDVGNYATDSGDMRLMGFIDSRLAQRQSLEDKAA